MPVSEYFKGKGASVLASMKSRYGDEKGERVFYATANAHHQKPGGSSMSKAALSGLRKAAKSR